MKTGFDYRSLLGPENPLNRFPRLFDAAVDEFSQKKWGEASLNDILRNANMSKGSLYHHFGDKFGLYLAVVDKIAEKKKAFFTPLLQGGLDSGDFFGAIKKISRDTMAFMFQDERLYHLSNRVLEAGPDLLSQLLPYFPYDYGQGFACLIQGAVRNGQIDPKYSPAFVGKMLDIIMTNLHKLVESGKPEDAYDRLVQVIDMMQYGLSGQSV